MSDLLPAWPVFATFLAASFVLAVTPGPGVLYIVTRSLAQGRASGISSVAGVALGNLGNAIGASLGLATLFAISSTAFTIVKFAGALYLIYLGIRTLFASAPPESLSVPEGVRHWRIFRDGFAVALLNPKTALFFAAFLPQFMNTGAPSILQSAVLGALFVAIAAFTDILYVLAAAMIAPHLARAHGSYAIGRYCSGGAFIGLGLLTAFAGPRNIK